MRYQLFYQQHLIASIEEMNAEFPSFFGHYQLEPNADVPGLAHVLAYIDFCLRVSPLREQERFDDPMMLQEEVSFTDLIESHDWSLVDARTQQRIPILVPVFFTDGVTWRLNPHYPDMSQSDNQPSASDRVILDEIRRVFGDVDRGGGVTLHETEVIDNYGSADARKQARRKDTDHHWWQVRDEWIDQFGGNGGLSFLDEAGFRYYLPAYMSYWIRTGEEPNSLAFHLRGRAGLELDRLCTLPEKKLIAKFLVYVSQRFDDEGACEALDGFWKRYLDVAG